MVPDLDFRVVAADAEPAAALLEAMGEEMAELYAGLDLPGPPMPPAVASEMAAPDGAFVVGYRRDTGEALCCGGLKRVDDTTCEIKRMYVVPSARGAGLARALLGELEDRARALGYVTARLDTGSRQGGAAALYRSAGYAEIERYHDNPVATYFAAKRLG